MSNQNATTPVSAIKGFDIEKLKDDEILKLEAEMRQKLELLQNAKVERETKVKTSALTEIKQAIDKVLNSQIVTPSELTQFLATNGYVVAPKAVAVEGVAKQGRRAINDEDLLFTMNFTSEDSGRSQTLKLDAESKRPAPASAVAKELKKLQEKTFEELKAHFTPKFFNEFIFKDESFTWVEMFFPKIQDKVDELAKAKQA